MTQITITDGTTTIIMPQTRRVAEAGEQVFIEKKMASGALVRDIQGFRPGYTYAWDWVPASTISSLVTMLRGGGFFTVDYFDVDGTDKSGLFAVSYPSFEVFAFRNGVAMWHNCSLTIKAQEVS